MTLNEIARLIATSRGGRAYRHHVRGWIVPCVGEQITLEDREVADLLRFGWAERDGDTVTLTATGENEAERP